MPKNKDGVTYANIPVTSNTANVDAPYNPFLTDSASLRLTSTLSYNTIFDCDDARANFRNHDNRQATVTGFYPARYYVWTDTNSDSNLQGNGFVDRTDTKQLYEIRRPSDATSNCTTGAICPDDDFSRKGTRTDCGGDGLDTSTVSCSYQQEMTNFANWFSYYRKRDLTTKAAVSKTIFPSVSRVGLGTIHDNNNAGILIKDDRSSKF